SPHLSGTNHTLRERVIRWRPARTGDTQNRVVTVVDAFDPKHGRVFHSCPVIAEPFAKRTVGLDVSRMNESFDGDFGVGRKRQTGYFPHDEIKCSFSDPAAVIVFGIAKLDGIAGGQK